MRWLRLGDIRKAHFRDRTLDKAMASSEEELGKIVEGHHVAIGVAHLLPRPGIAATNDPGLSEFDAMALVVPADPMRIDAVARLSIAAGGERNGIELGVALGRGQPHAGEAAFRHG